LARTKALLPHAKGVWSRRLFGRICRVFSWRQCIHVHIYRERVCVRVCGLHVCVCVCMCVHVYRERVCVCVSVLHVCVCVCIHVQIYRDVYTVMYIYTTYTYTHICACVCARGGERESMCVCVCCTCVRMCVYTCTYIP